MTKEAIQQYLSSLTDEELQAKTAMASMDMKHASQEQQNSDWHTACFAAIYVYCEEMNRRGLKLDINGLKEIHAA